MKTKYIKVAVADRLPEKDGFYFTSYSHLYYSIERQIFNDEDNSSMPEWYLIEVPDREEEMKAMLEECKEAINNCDWSIDEGAPHLKPISMKLEFLLQSLK